MLHPDDLLHPAPEVVVRFDSSGDTTLVAGPARLAAGRHGPAILDVFRPGRSLRGGLDRLAPRADSVGEWMRLAGTVRTAVGVGLLVRADGGPLTGRRPTGYAAGGIHRAMLDDAVRTKAFCQAVALTVNPGDVVVDLGTGSGVLAVAAARAGARRVYAIEVSDIATAAAEVARANGYGDVIEVVRGWSTEIDLPERADVLVTEMIGDEPLGEQILTIMTDAAERFLHPHARIVPNALDVLAWPVEVPDEVRQQRLITPGQVERWRGDYGVDLTPLLTLEHDRPVPHRQSAARTGAWRRLGPGTTVASVSLPTDRRLGDAPAELALTIDGTLGGVVLGFRAALAPGLDLTVGPGSETHWAPVTFLLPEPVAVRAGDQARVRVHHWAETQLEVDLVPAAARRRLAGLVVDTPIDLRIVEAMADGGEHESTGADVVVRRGSVDPPPGLVAAGPRARLSPDDVVLQVGPDRIRVRHGSEIVVDGPPVAASAERELTMLGAGLAALCLQRGLLPLHASTVVGPAGAVAVCGGRGVGKTTICARLDHNGRALLADDLTPIDAGAPDGPEALAGVRRFKLRQDGLTLLGLDPGQHRSLPMDGETKWPVPAWCPLPAGDRYPLVAVVVLVPDASLVHPTVEPLTGAEAVFAVHQACFRPRWLVEPRLASVVGAAALRIGATVPVLRLRRPEGPDAREAAVALVDDLLTGFRTAGR
jgi:hypothetical protein